jgi:hypothetical protein
MLAATISAATLPGCETCDMLWLSVKIVTTGHQSSFYDRLRAARVPGGDRP